MSFPSLVMRVTAVGNALDGVAAKAQNATVAVKSSMTEQEKIIADFEASSVVGHLITFYRQIVALGVGKNLGDLLKLEDIIKRFGGGKIDFQTLRNPGGSPGTGAKTRTSTSSGSSTTSLSTANAQGKMGW